MEDANRVVTTLQGNSLVDVIGAFAWQPVMKADAKVEKNGNTVAHIGHPFIFFTLKICNSHFYCKNPSCSISKFATRILIAEIRFVCISKFATRIFTAKIRVSSYFHCKGSSQNSKSELCISKFTTRTFSCRHVVTSWTVRLSSSTEWVSYFITLYLRVVHIIMRITVHVIE